MRRVAVITAGGSLTVKRGPAVSGAFPAVKGEDLIAQLPHVGVEPVFGEFSSLPGSHFTPLKAFELSKHIDSVLAAPDVDGVVVTHGTDTLEETAYMAELTISATEPVVFTGAARPPTVVGFDGLLNLSDAIRVAAAPEAAGLGVLVVFGGQVLAATEAAPVARGQAFAAPDGPLGRVDGERVWLRHRPAQRLSIPALRIEERVELIAIGQGADDRALRRAVDDGAAGVVLEVFGNGRVPPWWLPAISEAIERRVAVVAAPRDAASQLHDDYGYVGAFHDLQRMGVLFAHHLSARKARIKLMVALGASRRIEELRGWFAQ